LTPRRAVIALAVLVLGAAGAIAALAVLNGRDDASVQRSTGPGDERGAGARPAVAPGNVLLLYSDERETAALRALALRTGGRETPALVGAGQAVIVRRRPGLRTPVLALSTHRRLDAAGPADPRLRTFVEYWLAREKG
jgi:hypothetical protein